MKNLALLLEYDGTALGGWQIQPNAPTVQESIQHALYELTSKPYILIGAGRTDAGVHSSGQVANMLLEDDFPIPEEKIAIALNTKLPKDIRIIKAKFVQQDFHARYDAIAREYEYFIHTKETVFLNRFSTYYKYPLDPDELINSAKVFIGENDFTSFSKLNTSTKSYICNIEKCKWKQIETGRFKLIIRADRFVYGMVRALVGAMLDCASGRLFISDLIFGLNNPNRENFVRLAPPQGLILKKVYYPNDIFD
jgi:tRNA pseudouridine38-40 synthase